jgi:hypothetical protein
MNSLQITCWHLDQKKTHQKKLCVHKGIRTQGPIYHPRSLPFAPEENIKLLPFSITRTFSQSLLLTSPGFLFVIKQPFQLCVQVTKSDSYYKVIIFLYSFSGNDTIIKCLMTKVVALAQTNIKFIKSNKMKFLFLSHESKVTVLLKLSRIKTNLPLSFIAQL